MKDKDTVFDFLKMIIEINKQTKMSKFMDDPTSIDWRVDLYASFYYSDLLPEYKASYNIDLWQYYTKYNGWGIDKIDYVIDLLRRVRFFNRFDFECLRNLVSHVTLHKVEKRTLLFLEQSEAAIIVAGQIYLFSHEEDVACPCLQAIYNPGDIIGIEQLDNGWSRAQHSWLVANEDCDVFLCAKGYVNYMWDRMKKFKSNIVADMLQQTNGFAQMSEQTLFTIAHDIALFKEYGPSEMIVAQDINSIYNLKRINSEVETIRRYTQKEPEFIKIQRQFLKNKYPKIQELWDNQEEKDKIKNKERDLKLARHQAEMEFVGLPQKRQEYMEQRFSKETKEIVAYYEAQIAKHTKENETQEEFFRHLHKKLENFQQERKRWNDDADGIYVIVRGEAIIINPYDNLVFWEPLQKFTVIGASKFLNQTGNSYYGDIYTSKPDPKKNTDQKIWMKKGKSILIEADKLGKNTNEVQTVCLFIPKEKLYLIPFFDLYALRTESRAEAGMIKAARERYKKRVK